MKQNSDTEVELLITSLEEEFFIENEVSFLIANNPVYRLMVAQT